MPRSILGSYLSNREENLKKNSIGGITMVITWLFSKFTLPLVLEAGLLFVWSNMRFVTLSHDISVNLCLVLVLSCGSSWPTLATWNAALPLMAGAGPPLLVVGFDAVVQSSETAGMAKDTGLAKYTDYFCHGAMSSLTLVPAIAMLLQHDTFGLSLVLCAGKTLVRIPMQQ